MNSNQDLETILDAIFDRIAKKEQTEGDMQTLRQLLRGREGQSSIKIGKYNIDISKATNLRIGDNNYQGADAEAIKEALRSLLKERQIFKKQHARFVQFMFVGLSIILILSGFINLLKYDLIFETKCLLILGCLFIALFCSYYVFFWEPSISPCSKVIWKLFAAVGMVVIPFLTLTGVGFWMNAPTTNPIVTLANYYVDEKDLNASRVELFDSKTSNQLVDGTKLKGEKDIEIKEINKAFTFTKDKEARSEAKDRRAAISIWGQYVTNDPNIKDQVKVISFIELLKKPSVILIPDKAEEQYKQAEEEYEQKKYLKDVSEDVLKPSKVSIEVADNTDKKLAYYTNFVAGLAHYESGLAHCAPKKNVISKEAKESFEKSLKYLQLASKNLNRNNIQENKSELSKFLNKPTLDFFLMSVTKFYSGNTHIFNAYCSKKVKDYDLAIDSFTKAIEFISEYVVTSDNRQNSYVVEYPYSLILASYPSDREYTLGFNDGNDNKKIICGNEKQDKNVLVSNSPNGLKILKSRIYYNRGIAYAMKGDSEKALADYKKAVKLDSKTNEFCISIGSAYANLSNYYKNLVIYNSEDKRKSDDYTEYYSYYAIKNYKNGIGKNPDAENSPAYYNLGNIYLRQSYHKRYFDVPPYYDSRYYNAIRFYQKAIQLDSSFYEAHNNIKIAKKIRHDIFVKPIIDVFNSLIGNPGNVRITPGVPGSPRVRLKPRLG